MNFIINNQMSRKLLNRHWEYCVGSCHAPMLLRADCLEQLKRVHDDLGIKYVRFHGIFNDDMNLLMDLSDLYPFEGAERFKQVSFRKVGLVYDNVLACGMKPYVEMSFMPKHLAREQDKRSSFYYGGYICGPKNDQEWISFIQDFVRFLIRRYGAKEVETWPFEVWNEPDVFVFWSGTKEEYYHLYEITARAVKDVNPNIKVGGPATSGSKWIGSFVKFCRENSVPIDFISTHQYAGDPIGGVTSGYDLEEEQREEFVYPTDQLKQLFTSLPSGMDMLSVMRLLLPDKSETEDINPDTFSINSAIVKKQAEELPVYYSEWNENAIFSSATNDTRKVAAYIIRAALTTEKNIAGSSVWCFSDIFEEMSEFPQEFHGGFGLQTNNGIKKPQYYALQMLHEAADHRIDLGDNSMTGEIGIAAFEDKNKMQVLFVRQKMKNLDLPKEKASVKIEFDGTPSQVFLQRIDEDCCNPLKLWNEMGSAMDLTASEIAAIKNATEMRKEEIDYVIEDGVITIEINIGVNDIYFVTLEKQQES